VLAGLAIASLLGLAYSVRVARLRALARMRLRIARDLHDEVGANLGSISLLAQVMERKPSATDAVQVREIATQTIDTLRDIVWFIDPTHEHLGDLVARMEETSRRIAGHLRFSFQARGDFHSANLSLEFRRNAVPILKEALHNALKHSGGTAIEVRVSRSGNRFRLEIEDNGAGFDPAAHFGGNGLKNMRKRGLEMHGQVEFRSSPGKGTIVALEAPIT
jgi:signal transduction histidine kinase